MAVPGVDQSRGKLEKNGPTSAPPVKWGFCFIPCATDFMPGSRLAKSGHRIFTKARSLLSRWNGGSSIPCRRLTRPSPHRGLGRSLAGGPRPCTLDPDRGYYGELRRGSGRGPGCGPAGGLVQDWQNRGPKLGFLGEYSPCCLASPDEWVLETSTNGLALYPESSRIDL